MQPKTPNSYGAFAGALLRQHRAARFGGSVFPDTNVLALGDYMDEVNREVLAFDAWVRELERNPGEDHCGQGFFGSWNQYINGPIGLYDTNRPYGWRAWFNENRGVLDRLYEVWIGDAPLWAATEQYEDELIRFHDLAVQCGATPATPRPERNYQPPPPDETPAGQAAAALKYAAVIGALFGVGYLLRGLPKGGR